MEDRWRANWVLTRSTNRLTVAKPNGPLFAIPGFGKFLAPGRSIGARKALTWAVVWLSLLGSFGVTANPVVSSGQLLGFYYDPGQTETWIWLLTDRAPGFATPGPPVQGKWTLRLDDFAAADLGELDFDKGPVRRVRVVPIVDAGSGLEIEFELAEDIFPRLTQVVAGLELRFSPASEVTAPLRLDSSRPPDTGLAADAAALVSAARLSVERRPVYDASYVELDFPGGDPGLERGCGADLVVRAFRGQGVDLQVLIQQDVAADKVAYGVDEPNPNIDHRRVRNLRRFFARQGSSLAFGPQADWQPGDLVFWSREGRSWPNYVGLLTDRRTAEGRPLVIHHPPGSVPKEEDVLLKWPIRGHFRWFGESGGNP